MALLRTPDGVLWAGSTRGLSRLLPGGALTRVDVPGLPARSVTVLAAGPRGGLLVGVTESGLFEVDAAASAARRVGSDDAPGRNVSGLVREAEGGGIWIATSDQGAFRWDGASSFERFGMAEGLPDARVWAAFEDREGILWFGTDSGLAKRGPAAFRTFGPEDGLPAGVAALQHGRDAGRRPLDRRARPGTHPAKPETAPSGSSPRRTGCRTPKSARSAWRLRET